MDFSLGPPRPSGATGCARSWTSRSARATGDYEAQQREGDRWKVLPVIEELKAKARGRGAVEPVHAAVATALTPVDDSFEFEGPRLTNLAICLCAEEMGRIVLVVGGVQLLRARHRQYGGAPPLRHARAEGRVAEAADGRRDPLRLPDDRARRRLVGRDQHRVQHRAATATTMSSTAANGGRSAPAIRAARSRS